MPARQQNRTWGDCPQEISVECWQTYIPAQWGFLGKKGGCLPKCSNVDFDSAFSFQCNYTDFWLHDTIIVKHKMLWGWRKPCSREGQMVSLFSGRVYSFHWVLRGQGKEKTKTSIVNVECILLFQNLSLFLWENSTYILRLENKGQMLE